MKVSSVFGLKQRPYDLLGVMALVLFLASFITSADAFDINLHDAYFVIAAAFIYRIFSGILLFLWLVNMVSHKGIFSGKLSRLTVGGTILSFVIIFSVLWAHVELPGPPRRYYAFTEFEKVNVYNVVTTVCVLIAILLFTISQLAFIGNVIGGLISKKKGRIVHDS
jgi:heme/copper-type cytochrome/quinol oxidase subunit 1